MSRIKSGRFYTSMEYMCLDLSLSYRRFLQLLMQHVLTFGFMPCFSFVHTRALTILAFSHHKTTKTFIKATRQWYYPVLYNYVIHIVGIAFIPCLSCFPSFPCFRVFFILSVFPAFHF